MLNPLLEKKQAELEKNLNIQQLLFDIDEELKWIEQSGRQIEVVTAQMPQTLFEATNISKKFDMPLLHHFYTLKTDRHCNSADHWYNLCLITLL